MKKIFKQFIGVAFAKLILMAGMARMQVQSQTENVWSSSYSSFQVGAPASSRAGLGRLRLWMQMAQFERSAREDAGAPNCKPL